MRQEDGVAISSPPVLLDVYKRQARKGGAMVQEIKQVYDLIEESMDAYLSSLTVQMLLDCARNGDNSRTFLAERLQEESRRLLDAVK